MSLREFQGALRAIHWRSQDPVKGVTRGFTGVSRHFRGLQGVFGAFDGILETLLGVFRCVLAGRLLEVFKDAPRGFRGKINYGDFIQWDYSEAFRGISGAHQGHFRRVSETFQSLSGAFQIDYGNCKSYSMRLWRFQGYFETFQGRFKGTS